MRWWFDSALIELFFYQLLIVIASMAVGWLARSWYGNFEKEGD
jgi:hypothetical protein